uniref:Pseudouridylate synthase 1 homolog n=1 Tax=Loa loa TaxID=7209 RepID=A0A1I7W1Z0_LOALO
MLRNVSDVLRKTKVKVIWMDAFMCASSDSASDVNGEPVRKSRRKEYSYALLLAYQGKKYNGMQVQKDFPTVEGELFKAMAKCGYISEDDILSPVRFAFQRAARTDRSVSAARQMCSMRLAPENHEYFLKTASDKLNAQLPEEIRVMGVRRATRSFKAHKNCDKRTYSYTLPSYAFARADELTNSAFRISETSVTELNDLLALYKGTHNFFNYTSGRRVFNSAVNQYSTRTYEDRSNMRYIHDFKCGPTQLVEDKVRGGMVEFISLYVTGQSFMLHQIRKMIGMTVATFRGLCGKTELENTFRSERMDVPKAPGLGLVLDKVHYERYDRWYEKTHQKLNNWGDEIEARADEFRKLYIIAEIYRQELATHSMFLWLTTLLRHDIMIPGITRESRERSPLGLASDRAYLANEELKEMKKEKENQIFVESNEERRDHLAELIKKDSNSQSGENSEGSHTDTIVVMGTSPRRVLDSGES